MLVKRSGFLYRAQMFYLSDLNFIFRAKLSEGVGKGLHRNMFSSVLKLGKTRTHFIDG